MRPRFQLAVIDAVLAAPAQAATVGLDCTLSVTARQQRIDGVAQPLVLLPPSDQRVYSGRLDISFGGASETLMPTATPGHLGR